MSETLPLPASPKPKLRPVSFQDIREALVQGWRDFRAAPSYGLFFGGFYALGGFAILMLLNAYGKPWMIVPIAIGFPLLGPFVAAGLYEVSRRLHAGEPMDFGTILGFMLRQGRREFSWMAFIVLFLFWIWMYQARVMIALFLDMKAFSSFPTLLETVFTTQNGLTMLLLGSISGTIVATILFTTTVIAMPLLVDREHDIVTAIVTSWKTVLDNPGPMLAWGAIVGAITLLAMLPAFLGLFVALPVLGHATWHLYRHAVEPL